MAEPEEPKSKGGAFTTLLAVVAIGLFALAWAFPPKGGQGPAVPEFLGRFHPVLVHLPIGLLLIVPVMELLAFSARFKGLRDSAGFILAVGAFGAVAAAFDGWILGVSGAYAGAAVVRHMWGGVAVAVLAVATLGTRQALASKRSALGWFYPLLLAATVVTLSWAGHEGGNLTHGDGFLTRYMPDPLRKVLGLAAPAEAPTAPAAPTDHSAYTVRIAPIFQKSCVSCHKADKHKGGLRMDSYAELMKGGNDGPALVPGDPKASEIVRRVSLPREDDDFMPSDGHNLLTAEQIELLTQWIAWGANGPQPTPARPAAPARP